MCGDQEAPVKVIRASGRGSPWRRCASMPLLAILSVVMSLPVLAVQGAGEVFKQLDTRPLSDAAPTRREAEEPLIQLPEETIGSRGAAEHIDVQRIVVEGATLLGEDTIASIVRPKEGSSLTLDELHTLARSLTKAYRQRGYLIAYAYVPPQEVRDGVVHLRVVEGTVGKIYVLGNKYYSYGFVAGHLNFLREYRGLPVADLERALMLLNEYPSFRSRAYLRAGDAPGTTDIVIQARDSRHLHGGFAVNNYGSRATSHYRVEGWLEAGSVLQEGDLLELRATTGIDRIDPQRLSFGRIAYTIPLGYDGKRFGIHFATSVFRAGQDLAPLDIKGSGKVAGFWFSWPWVRQPDASLDTHGGFDYKNLTDEILGATRSKDRIRSLYLGLKGEVRDGLGGATSFLLPYIGEFQRCWEVLGRPPKGRVVSRPMEISRSSLWSLYMTRH